MVQNGSERRSRSVCGGIRMSHAPEVIHFGRFAFHSARHRVNIAVAAQQISQNYTSSCRQGQHQCGKASSQGEYSDMIGETGMVDNFDVSLSSSFIRKKRANTVSQTRMYKLCSPPGRLAKIACGGTATSFGHGSQCRTISIVKNTNRPHSLGEEQNSTLGISLTVIGIFLYQSM